MSKNIFSVDKGGKNKLLINNQYQTKNTEKILFLVNGIQSAVGFSFIILNYVKKPTNR